MNKDSEQDLLSHRPSAHPWSAQLCYRAQKPQCMTFRAARNKPNSRRTVVFLFFVCKGGTSRLSIFCYCLFRGFFFFWFFCNCSGQTYFLKDKMEFYSTVVLFSLSSITHSLPHKKFKATFVHCIQILNEHLAQGLGT